MPRSQCAFTPLLLCLLLALTGCGGGGGSSTSTPPPTGASNPVPTTASVTPSSANAGDAATAVTVTGSDFISASAVQWNGTALATTFVSSSSLQATIPATDLASGIAAKVTVENPSPGGGPSAALTFTVNNPVPAIATITPPNASAGSSDIQATITGSGFVPSTSIVWNNAALTTTYVSATQLKATIPASDLAAGSEATITAKNSAPSGGTSSGVKFDVKSAAPLIQSISPRIVKPGSAATTITITGSGFDKSSIVQFNSSPRPTTFVSATQLQVLLSATDLQTAQLGMLQVTNAGPGATPSTPIGLAVSAAPLPTIQSVSIANVQGFSTPCPKQLAATITGTNLSSSPVVSANGTALNTSLFVAGPPQQISGYMPAGFIAKPGALSFTVTVTGFDLVPLTSDPFAYPASAPAALSVCASPSPATVYPASSFTFNIQPSEVNISGNATVTLGTLPAGITATAPTVTIPSTGGPVHLRAANTTALGSYDLSFTAAAGTATASSDFPFSVANAGTAAFLFSPHNFNTELGAPIGGSGSIIYDVLAPTSPNGTVIFDVTPSLSTLPTGTTATFSSTPVSVGQTLTVTLSAAANAPVTQNYAITLTGTPSAPIPTSTAQFFADVTQPPGSLADSRTDFVGTVGTPYAAAFDPIHNLIFSSNPDWNRVDVISNSTHKIVKTIPIRAPRGIDVTPDSTHVWVQTATSLLYEIDTTTLQAVHFTLPASTLVSNGVPPLPGVDSVSALSDGTVLLVIGDANTPGFGVFNPQNNQFTVTTFGIGSARRTPDGTHVFMSTGNTVVRYDVSTHSAAAVGPVPSPSAVAAVNSDGSRLALNVSNSVQLFDNHLNNLGILPGLTLGSNFLFQAVFSADNSKLYEIVGYHDAVSILTIDVATLHVLGSAPALAEDPSFLGGPFGTSSAPFAIDSTGMLLGIDSLGIAFDDSTFYQNYVLNQPLLATGNPGLVTYGGPLAGGTVSQFNAFPSLTPAVWFGTTRGSADTSQGQLTFTSPPSTTPGPVNVKFIYPDGIQAFFPQLFEYGVTPEFSVLSGSSPDGGAPASIVGFGLPQDVSGGSVTVGANQATITTLAGQYPPFIDDGSQRTTLNYTFPPGNPGLADLQVTTPNGSGSLPKSIVYAKSVTDYSTSDQPNAVLLDAKRHQIYLSAGDHVNVFSTTSNQFLAPLHPAAQGATKQFGGMALTPDGGFLLVTDVTDGSLAVIDPDTPLGTFSIPVFGAPDNGNGCPLGPIYVAATSTSLAFVQTGSLPASSCPSQSSTYITNLLTHTSTQLSNGCQGGVGIDATSDGNFVALSGLPCIYSTQTGSYSQGAFPVYYGNFGVAISADGNLISQSRYFGDINANLVGLTSHPIALYGIPTQPAPPPIFLNARLNDSGSLLFTAYPNYFEIVDVAHGTLRLRFSLTEIIQGAIAPLAIDSGGRFVYLITDKGLTVVDFGEAPLSIGHLSAQTAAPNTQITVRGSGFDSSITATVGGVAATVSVTDENTLTLTIPAATSGPQDIVLTRTGTYAETYTLENAIVLP